MVEVQVVSTRTRGRSLDCGLALEKCMHTKRLAILISRSLSLSLLTVGFDVAKTGVGRIGFVGFPSVGKSTLMSKLTGTHSEVAAYEFTTLTTVPGVVQYNGAKLQILDLPGIIEGAKDGKGRGTFSTLVLFIRSFGADSRDDVKGIQIAQRSLTRRRNEHSPHLTSLLSTLVYSNRSSGYCCRPYLLIDFLGFGCVEALGRQAHH